MSKVKQISVDERLVVMHVETRKAGASIRKADDGTLPPADSIADVEVNFTYAPDETVFYLAATAVVIKWQAKMRGEKHRTHEWTDRHVELDAREWAKIERFDPEARAAATKEKLRKELEKLTPEMKAELLKALGK